MSDTLRDQLLGLGFKPVPKPERKNDGPRRDGRPPGKGGEGPGTDLFDPGHVGHEGRQLRALLVGDALRAGGVPVDVGQGPLTLLDPVQRPREIEWHRRVLQLTSQ